MNETFVPKFFDLLVCHFAFNLEKSCSRLALRPVFDCPLGTLRPPLWSPLRTSDFQLFAIVNSITWICSSSFGYLLWDSDVRYITDIGQKQLPLSKHRFGPSPDYAIETSAIVPLHAPIAQRVIKIIASRNGNWPSIPNPVPSKTDPTTLREVLVSKKEVLDTPKARQRQREHDLQYPA